MVKKNKVDEWWLSIADLHFSTQPGDDFYWDVFRQLKEIITTSDKKITTLFIVGDLTNAKDNHSSVLVNLIADALERLTAETGVKIVIIRGNHDGINPNIPFFKWTRFIKNISYVWKPEQFDNVLILPHSENPVQEWKDFDLTDKIIFTHVAVDGVTVANGYKLPVTLKPEFFDKAAVALSGDIHTQQKIGNLEYIGSPYATTFGDNDFVGRGVLLNPESLELVDVKFEFPKRLTFDVATLEDFENQAHQLVMPKDQVKVRLHLSADTMGTWLETKESIKNWLIDNGAQLRLWELVGIKLTPKSKEFTPEQKSKRDPFEIYCQTYGIEGEIKERGRQICSGV